MSYPSIYALGHRAIKDIFESYVIIEEKVDGSQFSFWLDSNYDIHFRSKNCDLFVEGCNNLFRPAVEYLNCFYHQNKNGLRRNHVYYAESLCKPKHNVLKYNIAPLNGFVIFDIETNPGTYDFYSRAMKEEECIRLGFDVVPILDEGKIEFTFDSLTKLLDKYSYLGGTKVEGVVIKNYDRFTFDKKPMFAKFVSERFKEQHKQEYKVGIDIITQIVNEYKTEAFWWKQVQHLKEAGKLEGSPKDIGTLIAEGKRDLSEESGMEISEKLTQWGWKQIAPRVMGGIAEWYKEYLAKGEFE